MGAAEEAGWSIERRGPLIHATFRGFLDAHSGKESAVELERQLAGSARVELHLDVGAMDGYANEARNEWGKVIRRHRHRIAAITTQGAGPLERLGASVLGMLARVRVSHE